MSITATVHDDMIKLPQGVHLEDATEVLILPKNQAPLKTFAERYAKYIGILKDGPTDLAANHDHYLYGSPKRES